MSRKLILSSSFLWLLSLLISPSVFGAECTNSLFQEDSLNPELSDALERFQSLTYSFKPDSNVDIIFEVSIEDKSVAEIEEIITDGESNYFVVGDNSLSTQVSIRF